MENEEKICLLTVHLNENTLYQQEKFGGADMNYIEQKWLKEAFESVTGDCTCPMHIAAEIYQILDCTPVADVSPVVRCRECKHGKCGIDNMVKCNHPCGKVIYTTTQDFCSYGERKDGDDNG